MGKRTGEGTASAKALRWEGAWCVLGAAGQPGRDSAGGMERGEVREVVGSAPMSSAERGLAPASQDL